MITRALLSLALSLFIPSSFAQQTLLTEVISQPSVVFNWSSQRCDDQDIPDVPLRALRIADSTVLAFASSVESRRFLGVDLNSIKRDCALVYKSRHSADPAEFADNTWIASTWSDDGKTIYALSHNEYHGHVHPGYCALATYFACWYNTIGLLRSDDEGRSFHRVAKKPIAAPAFQQDVEQGSPRGFFEPSNIIKHNGAYYALIRTTGSGPQGRGICLFRSSNLNDISSWTYFDGQEFTPSALDPYTDDVSQVRPCAPIEKLNRSIGSVVFHERTGLFVAVMLGQQPKDQDGEILISTSRDLFNWTDPQVLIHLPLAFSVKCEDAYRFTYPSLVDPISPSRNFETVSDYPFLYLTRLRIVNCRQSLNRDLIRIGVHLSFR